MEAKTLRLEILVAESNPFPEDIKFENLMEGMKGGKYKYTYSAKGPERDILLSVLENKKMKPYEDDLK